MHEEDSSTASHKNRKQSSVTVRVGDSYASDLGTISGHVYTFMDFVNTVIISIRTLNN